MPTEWPFPDSLWNYRSTNKFYRKTKVKIDKILYLVWDRYFDKANKVYVYKMIPL